MRKTVLTAAAITFATTLVVLLWLPLGADYPAQVYREWLFREHGLTIYNAFWYDGHHTLSYSLLLPPLSALVKLRILAVLLTTASSALFSLLIFGAKSRRPALASYWFAFLICTTVVIGQIAFLLGVTFALLALFCYQQNWRALAVISCILCPLASPVAALFLALAGFLISLETVEGSPTPAKLIRNFGIVIPLCSLLPVAILVTLFPEGGSQPFPIHTYSYVAGFCILALLLLRNSTAQYLYRGTWLYFAIATLVFLIPSPIGSNITRLGLLFGGPLLLTGVMKIERTRRIQVIGTLAITLTVVMWQLWPSYQAVRASAGDPSRSMRYYQPLIKQIKKQSSAPVRVEIPFTKNHWEAAYCARYFPLARGWERQLDRKYNPIFYQDQLTETTYRNWLDRHAVSFVAIPNTELDPAGIHEAALVSRGLTYLKPVWRNRDWRLYKVAGSKPLVSGAELTGLEPDKIELRANRPTVATVRTHYSPYLRADQPGVEIGKTEAGWVKVTFKVPTTVQIRTSLTR